MVQRSAYFNIRLRMNDLPGHICPLILSPCHHGGRGSSSAGRGEEGGQVCQPHPRQLFSPIAVETMGVLGPHTKTLLRDLCRWVTQTTEEKTAITYLIPEAVSGSAAGQLCLSDGHHRPTRFWSFLLAKLPTQNAVGLILVYV